MDNEADSAATVLGEATYETHSLLVGAYKGIRVSRRATLTHTVRLENGHFVAVICGRVSLDSVADCEADDISAPPTCRRCARKDPRQSDRDEHDITAAQRMRSEQP